MNTIELIDRLEQDKSLQKEEWIHVIEDDSEENRKYAAHKARALADRYYGKEIFVRGLIEFTNYCKNDCYYCGIRCSNKKANRYRLSEEDILACCEEGDRLGFRTFVLQGGEDPYYTDDKIVDIVREIKKLIVFTAIIFLCIWKYEVVFQSIHWILDVITPFLIGGAIAFIIGIPVSYIEKNLL